ERAAFLQWSHGVAAVETPPCRRAGCTARPFNGATASPPWKPGAGKYVNKTVLVPSMEPRRRRRGNLGLTELRRRDGAHPSMEPRRRRRGNRWTSSGARSGSSCLQWSHGVAAVETGVPRRVQVAPETLQWSHGVAAVETSRTRARRPSGSCLQWSHGVAAVETASSRSTTPPPSPFNGATASPPWKRPLELWLSSGYSVLQW